MIEFVSINSIVTDLLDIIRGAQVTQSEPISENQLENWVHQYRALILKRDLDKGKMPNPDYIQEIAGLQLEAVDYTDDLTNVEKGESIYRTSLQLPNTIDLNHKSGFTYVGTADGFELQFIPEARSRWQQYKKFTPSDPMVYLKNNYLYVVNAGALKYLTVRGIFEVPTEVINFVNGVTGQSNYDRNDPYPVPIDKVPVIKELILQKELGVEAKAYSDRKTDSEHEVEPNLPPQTK